MLTMGCSADWYRHDADLQVHTLLRDREQTTLGYHPSTTLPREEAVAPPTQRSYRAIPATPLPPPRLPQVEPAAYELKFGPLGPEPISEHAGAPLPDDL